MAKYKRNRSFIEELDKWIAQAVGPYSDAWVAVVEAVGEEHTREADEQRQLVEAIITTEIRRKVLESYRSGYMDATHNRRSRHKDAG